MGRSYHHLPAQALQKRERVVVRKEGYMTKSNKQTRGMDWAAIFKRRPDLIPPGYQEVVNKLYPKEESNDKPS